jgi:hypothetical protein
MFGSSFFGLIDKKYHHAYLHLAKMHKKYDMNDFIYHNCAYNGPLPASVTSAAPSTSQVAPLVGVPWFRRSSTNVGRCNQSSHRSGARSRASSPVVELDSDMDS